MATTLIRRGNQQEEIFRWGKGTGQVRDTNQRFWMYLSCFFFILLILEVSLMGMTTSPFFSFSLFFSRFSFSRFFRISIIFFFSSFKFLSNSFSNFFCNRSATFVSQDFFPPLSCFIAEHLCVCVVFQNRPDFGRPRGSSVRPVSSISLF